MPSVDVKRPTYNPDPEAARSVLILVQSLRFLLREKSVATPTESEPFCNSSTFSVWLHVLAGAGVQWCGRPGAACSALVPVDTPLCPSLLK